MSDAASRLEPSGHATQRSVPGAPHELVRMYGPTQLVLASLLSCSPCEQAVYARSQEKCEWKGQARAT